MCERSRFNVFMKWKSLALSSFNKILYAEKEETIAFIDLTSYNKIYLD